MALTPGSRLGPYEVVAPLGAGGMGEVYRARDTTLGREVALKTLPASFASDPERLARFEREAKTLAALNHPHIAQIYGFERAADACALVMELVEGEDLSQRIARGPIPLDEALPIARQVAEALDAAHEQGIVHRDLKPANIKVRSDGVVKVLDFGLAKLAQPESAGSQDVTASPTITSPARMTGIGVILGTAAYMSPEQAKGREADRRSDIWAFGAVLYEMLSGRRAFDGEDMAEVLGAVVRLEPSWEALPAEVPLPVRTLLHSCLVKDRGRRVADISTALFVLDKAASLAAPAASLAAEPRSRPPLWHRATRGAALVTMGALLSGAGVWSLSRREPPAVVRTTITTSGSTRLMLNSFDRDVAITPDGSRIVYRGDNQLLVRALNQLEPTVLSGLGAPQGVFISPDGQWVGFFDGSTMKKVAITGGPPVTVCAGQTAPRGATWSDDGTIVFATGTVATGLQRVSAAGGEPVVLTKPDYSSGESDHLWPEFLPGGNAVLFTISALGGSIENAQIAVLDLQTGSSKVLIRGGSHAHYVRTGHLVYGVTGTLRAVAFDLNRLEVVGTPTPVLEGVVTTALGAADVAVAANGSLVYIPGSAGGGGQRTVVAVDRQGQASSLPNLPPNLYRSVRVSPDGGRLALATLNDIWIYDVTRASMTRLTTGKGTDTNPLWTPDGQRIVFTSRRARYPELFWRMADGTGIEERLLARANDLVDLTANGWSEDGTNLLFTETSSSAQVRGTIGQVVLERPSDVRLLVNTGFNNGRAAVSPGGGWMAYESNPSGQMEIYVERYPELGNRQMISTGGGRLPVWSGNGRELFFGTPDGRRMFVVAVHSGTTLVVGRPQVLFESAALPIQGGSRSYDVAPDGRFLIIRPVEEGAAEGTASNLIVVQNWFEELKQRVPVQ